MTTTDKRAALSILTGAALWEASQMLEFEYAAALRDRIIELRGQ